MTFIREPAVSGTFYPANSAVLQRDIRGYLNNVPQIELDGTVAGIIAPHAGYVYSGQVAAHAYRTIVNASYDTVVVVAPSHRVYFRGVAVLKEGSCRTPLGLIEIDEELAQAVSAASTLIQPNLAAHAAEHSLEVQLPFLQVVLQRFRLLPLVMGIQDPATCRVLADAVFNASLKFKRNILIVGSTDLSHYHSDRNAVALDSIVVKRLQAFDEAGLMADVAQEKCEACGTGPMAVAMMVSKMMGATESRVLKYAHSGDVSGDRSAVVGYVSAVLVKKQS
jgi:MEMO1 family protein